MIQIRQTEVYSDWYSRLKDQRAKARIDIRVRRLSLGNPGDVRPVGSAVSELRIDYGPGYRIYYAQRDAELIILLCGGDKGTQSPDIAKAKELAKQLES